jgi:hypothetical protein
MPVKLIPNADRIEIHVPECFRCGSPMRLYHYSMKQLTHAKNETWIETEGEKLTKIHDFEFLCPNHKKKKEDAYHMTPSELVVINEYDKSQFRMIVEGEPGAKVAEKLYFGKDAKKMQAKR